MTKKDVKLGAFYRMKHRSGYVDVLILGVVERDRGGYTPTGSKYQRTITHWRAKNMYTGRQIEIKSAAKLLREVTPPRLEE